MAQNCARKKKTIKAKDSRTGKAVSFMSKPSGCGKPAYDRPTAAQKAVRKAIAGIGKACADTGSMGGKQGISASRKACVRSAAKLVF